MMILSPIFLLFALLAFFGGLGALLASTDKNYTPLAPLSFSTLYAALSFFAAIANLFIISALAVRPLPDNEATYIVGAVFFQFILNLILGAYFGWRRGQRVAHKQLAQTP